MSSVPGPADVLRFWFGELKDGFAAPRYRKRWFTPTAAVDAEIRERFGSLWQRARDGSLAAWSESLPDALALVILCDQFPRQIHRGSAQAYDTDALALSVARRLIEQGADARLGFDERAFLYMPFQHAESRLDQHTAVGLYVALQDTTPADLRQHAEGFLKHARQHRDIVLQFGRFPHRNQALGRASTAEENAFLETAPRFGQ